VCHSTPGKPAKRPRTHFNSPSSADRVKRGETTDIPGNCPADGNNPAKHLV
jgi:hypothetical protein